jgi:hypothetical protein
MVTILKQEEIHFEALFNSCTFAHGILHRLGTQRTIWMFIQNGPRSRPPHHRRTYQPGDLHSTPADQTLLRHLSKGNPPKPHQRRLHPRGARRDQQEPRKKVDNARIPDSPRNFKSQRRCNLETGYSIRMASPTRTHQHSRYSDLAEQRVQGTSPLHR